MLMLDVEKGVANMKSIKIKMFFSSSFGREANIVCHQPSCLRFPEQHLTVKKYFFKNV